MEAAPPEPPPTGPSTSSPPTASAAAPPTPRPPPPLRPRHHPPRHPVATATVELTELHQGPPGYIHGGIVATLCDEAMSKLNRPLNVLAMTRHMEVDYLRPAPLHTPLTLTARHLRREGSQAASSSTPSSSTSPPAKSSPAAKASSSSSTPATSNRQAAAQPDLLATRNDTGPSVRLSTRLGEIRPPHSKQPRTATTSPHSAQRSPASSTHRNC